MKRPFRRQRLARWLRGEMTETALMGLGEDDRNELLYEANHLLEKGKIEDASKVFLLTIGHFRETAEPWIGMGVCAQIKGDIPLAMGHYEVALSKRPGDPHALANLAECCLLNGDLVAAKFALAQIKPESILKLSPDLASRIRELEVIANKETQKPPVQGDHTSPDNPVSTAEVIYSADQSVTEAEFRSLLERSTLAERRPMNEPGAIGLMLVNAGVIVTARVDGKLVGISRALSDASFCTYLSDLAVDRKYQKRGIGRELIRRTHEAAGLNTTLILLAAPLARDYYPHIGMRPHDSCWIIPRTVTPPASETTT